MRRTKLRGLVLPGSLQEVGDFSCHRGTFSLKRNLGLGHNFKFNGFPVEPTKSTLQPEIPLKCNISRKVDIAIFVTTGGSNV